MVRLPTANLNSGSALGGSPRRIQAYLTAQNLPSRYNINSYSYLPSSHLHTMQSVLRRATSARAGLFTRASRPLASTYRSQTIRTLISTSSLLSPLVPLRNHSAFAAKRYTSDHESVVFDDATGLGVVSITAYAQSSLGDVVFVELPAIGTEVELGCEKNNSKPRSTF